MSRKLKTYLAVIGGGLLLFCGMLAWSALGPPRALVVSRETTYLVEPLTEDGRVNYVGIIETRRRAGITPENNAAVPIAIATWPGELTADEQTRLQEELGIEEPLAAGLVDFEESEAFQRSVNDWPDVLLQDNIGDSDDYEISLGYYALEATYYPWRRDQISPLAEWVDASAPHLDRLHQLIDCERYYWPNRNWTPPATAALYDGEIDEAVRLRLALRALCTRANMYVGEENAAPAWRDLQAGWRICRSFPQPPSPLDVSLRQAFESMLVVRTHWLAQSGLCDQHLLREIARFLQALRRSPSIVDVAEDFGRLAALDGAAYHDDFSRELAEHFTTKERRFLLHLPYNKNATLTRVNQAYDEIGPLLAIDDFSKFHREDVAWTTATTARMQSWQADQSLFHLTLNQTVRGLYIADITHAGWTHELVSAKRKENIRRQEFRLLQMAVALQRYQVEHGQYPAALDDLKDFVHLDLAVDLYAPSQQLIYERRETGFLLYSVYLDANDDGGDSYTLDVVDGEWTPGNEGAPFIEENLDLVVRYPMPNWFPLEKPRTIQEEDDFVPPPVDMRTYRPKSQR